MDKIQLVMENDTLIYYQFQFANIFLMLTSFHLCFSFTEFLDIQVDTFHKTQRILSHYFFEIFSALFFFFSPLRTTLGYVTYYFPMSVNPFYLKKKILNLQFRFLWSELRSLFLLLLRTLILSSTPIYLPEAPPSNTITLVVGASAYKWGWGETHKNSVDKTPYV